MGKRSSQILDFIAVGELAIRLNAAEELLAVAGCDRGPHQCLVTRPKRSTDTQLHPKGRQTLFI